MNGPTGYLHSTICRHGVHWNNFTFLPLWSELVLMSLLISQYDKLYSVVYFALKIDAVDPACVRNVLSLNMVF
jgi:hypothetical protein